MTEPEMKKSDEGQLSDEQLKDVAGGLSDRHEQEFIDGIGNKGLSTDSKLTERFEEERDQTLGNQ